MVETVRVDLSKSDLRNINISLAWLRNDHVISSTGKLGEVIHMQNRFAWLLEEFDKLQGLYND